MTVSRSTLILILATVTLLALPAVGQIDKTTLTEMQEEVSNAGWTFTVGENEATQYPLEQICGLVEPADWKTDATFKRVAPSASVALPSTFDWRTYQGTTPIRNQGGCGSCWAFATVGPLECAIKIREGVSVNLSEQWLLSCNREGWTCSGGWYAHHYHGLIADGCAGTGAVLEADLPYVAYQAPCACPYPHHYSINSWAYIGDGGSVASISEMKQAILEYGPISVSIYASNYFQGYRSGVFNSCTDGTINHAVVLVGWDDNQGDQGVWFLRNSWGTSWGESGYMRIPYGCAKVGYAACYIDYKPVNIITENDFGPSPLSVNLQAEAPGTTVTGASWDFGDGETSTELNPIHLYDQPGCYSVKVTVNTPTGNLTRIRPNLVSAYADTATGAAVQLSAGGPVRLDIRVRNNLTLSKLTLPFTWAGPFNLHFDSISTATSRAVYFDQRTLLSWDAGNERAVVYLASGSQPPLPVGEGIVASLWFTAPTSFSGLNTIAFTEYSIYSPQFVSGDLAFRPALTNGYFYTELSTSCCNGRVGDVNQSGADQPTIGDISVLIDHLFISGVLLGCIEEADINQSGGATPGYDDLTIGDVSALIDYLFISQSSLLDCL